MQRVCEGVSTPWETGVLALDQGTTSLRAILFDSEQNILLAIRQHELTPALSARGMGRAGPDGNLVHAVCSYARGAGGRCFSVRCGGIGITQPARRLSCGIKIPDGLIHNAIVWQCRRTADIVDRLVQDYLSGHIRRTTGLVPDAYFFGKRKSAWLLDYGGRTREGRSAEKSRSGTVDSWLVWKLTGGKVHYGRDSMPHAR